MAAQIPTTTKQWTISSTDGSEGFDALKLSEVPVYPPGDSQVLVKMEAGSLNVSLLSRRRSRTC